MPKVLFYGSSDDLVEIEGDVPGCDEYPLGSGDMSLFEVILPALRTQRAVDERMLVMATYGFGGVWMFAWGLVDEDVPLPDWPTRYFYEGGYTMRLEIEVPDGAEVRPLTRNAHGEDVE